jgi:hypothetical protein
MIYTTTPPTTTTWIIKVGFQIRRRQLSGVIEGAGSLSIPSCHAAGTNRIISSAINTAR